MYEKDSKIHLISGGGQGTINLYELDTYNINTTLRGHVKVVDSVSLYQNDDKPYLASATRDGTLKIWSLDVNEFITSLDNKGVEVHVCNH